MCVCVHKGCLSDGGKCFSPSAAKEQGRPCSRKPASEGMVRCPAGQTKTPNQAHGCSSHPPFFLHELVVPAHPSALHYKTVGKCVNLGLLGMGAHPVVDVGLPAGDRDEDPLFCRIAACPCNIHPILFVCHPPYPGSHTQLAHTLPRQVSLARLTGRSTGMASDIAPALWPFWPLIRGAPSRRHVVSRDAS